MTLKPCIKLGIQHDNANLDTLDDKVKEILYEYYDSVFRGHRGINKMYEVIKIFVA
jgi:hypothetical protein